MLSRLAIGTITHAITAEQKLKEANIYAKLIKLDANASIKGCSYGLELESKNTRKAMQVLRKNDIHHREIK